MWSGSRLPDLFRLMGLADGDVHVELRTEAEFEDEEDLVSEDIAEIYAKQGLKSEAIEIYRKLSLLNPKKSAYFATQIEQLSK